jgi:hypothetical protein
LELTASEISIIEDACGFDKRSAGYGKMEKGK